LPAGFTGQQHVAMGDPCVRHVLVIVAMEEEVRPLIERFALARCEPSPFPAGAPMVAWRGVDVRVSSSSGPDGDGAGRTLARLDVVWCGADARFGGANNVATTWAAVACYASVAAFGAPDVCVSAGTAGGFGCVGARVGDAFVSEAIPPSAHLAVTRRC
jgi:hypothetical protein